MGFKFTENAFIHIPESRKLQIQESAKSSKVEPIIIEIEAIHSGLTLNNVLYSSEELNKEETLRSWTEPYPKPVIKNHDLRNDPLGRVISSTYGQSRRSIGKEGIILKALISDKDAIEKVLDRRYETVSVGGTAKHAFCSVCGKDVVKEGFCGHRPGNVYKTKDGIETKAYYSLKEITFDEISFVNAPADVNAGIIGVVSQQSAEKNKEGGKVNMEENQQTTEQKVEEQQTTEDLLSVIDNYTKVNESTQIEEQESEVKPKQQESNRIAEENQEYLESLKKQLEDLREENKRLQDENKLISEENEKLKSEKSDLEKEKQTLIKTNEQMAEYIRQRLTEELIDMRVYVGLEKEEEKEQLLKEYQTVSLRLIEKQLKEAKETLKTQQTIMKSAESLRPFQGATVTNPTLALNQEGSVLEDDGLITESTSTQKNENDLTLYEAVNTLVSFFSKK
ncbi:MAG: hypothetical protein N2043_02310 [Ignavibacterium sp.]|nr:hypothetical protein [Ignavibacterium sp.]